MRLRFLSLATLVTATGLAVSTAPGIALAAGSPGQPTSPVTTTPVPTTPVTTPAAKSRVALYLRNAYFVNRGAVTVPGRAFNVDGVVTPYVPGQWVTVRSSVANRTIKVDRLRVKPSPNGRLGLFSERVSSPGTGIVHVRVRHAATAQMGDFFNQRTVAVLGTGASFGSRGAFVSLIQQLLNAVHVWVPQTGVYDQHTGLALDAYHRLLGQGFAQTLDGRTISALLDGRGVFTVRHPRDGKHIEGDLHDQLLAETYGSKVYRIYPISSGKPSTPTVLGHFRVYRQTPGYLPDGMYYSSFFYTGYAVHGFDPAPDYPASHGCMRLPITDATSVYDWLRLGDVVDVYR
jgi:hypothetical protein